MLKLSINKFLDTPDSTLMNLIHLLKKVEEKDVYFYYHDIGFKHRKIQGYCGQTISNIVTSMEDRFDNISQSTLFKHLVLLLDISTWPEEVGNFGVESIQGVVVHFNNLLTKMDAKSKLFHRSGQH